MLNFAIIGTGRISANHIAAAAAMSGEMRLTAVCDILPDNINTALRNADVPSDIPKYSNYMKMMDEQRPDVVAIATDSGTHEEIGKHCLAHGAHCIIEKPIALSIRGADELIETAKQHDRVLSVCHQNRFNKGVQKIRKALDDRRFGKLSHIAAHVRWNRNEEYYRQADWRGKWASDGGCLMNQCIHAADIMRWFLGDVDEVFAYMQNARHPYIEGEDIGLALVRAKSGALGLFEGTVNVHPSNLEETIYLFGDNGTAKAAGMALNTIDHWCFADGLDVPEEVINECRELPPNVYGFGHQLLYKDTVNAIKTGRKPLVDGYEGRNALELVLAMYKSKLTGSPVRLPLNDFASTDMEGTF